MRSIPQIAEKACTKCGEVKSMDNYYLHRTKKTYSSRCKACVCRDVSEQAMRGAARLSCRELPVSRECVACHTIKPNDAFYARKQFGRLGSKCKDCLKADREKKKDRIAAYGKVYNQRNKDRINALSRQYHAVHKDEISKRKSEFSKQYPDKRRVNEFRRRARKTGSQGSFTMQEWRSLCAFCDHRCLRCGERKKLTVDHIVPLVHGGSNTIDNIQPLCLSCNSSKNSKTIDYRKSVPLQWVQQRLL